MSYSIDFTSEAIADLAKIDRTNQIRIARKIKWLGENFEQITLLSLTGNLSSFFKLRIGDYRVIYEKELFLLIELDIGERFITKSFTSF